MKTLHLKDGRDADVEVLEFEHLPPNEIYNSRVGQFAAALMTVAKAPLRGVKDHKGGLTVFWDKWPHLEDLALAQQIWYAMCECQISHVMYHNGKWQAVQCDHDDTHTPYDVEGDVAMLGLIT